MGTPIPIVVRSGAPYKDFKELMDCAKKNPGKIRCGTPGMGSNGDFNVRIINMVAGVDMTSVPFKGASPPVLALLGGHIEAASTGIVPLIPHIRSKMLKGIVTSRNLPEFPDIPTLKQLGYKQDLFEGWFAFFAPAGVPDEVIETLVPAIEKVVRDPTIYPKLLDLGMFLEYLPPDKLLAKMQEEYKTLGEVAQKFGMIK
jgi:tripartite-type tricarboxylate transporter receptor subunit TctC